MVRIAAWCEPGDEPLIRSALGELESAMRAVAPEGTVLEDASADVLLLWDRKADEALALERVDRLRSRGNRLPILVVARLWSHLSAARVLDCGADDCLVGPTWEVELRARIRALLRRSSGLWLATGDERLHLDRDNLVANIHGCQVTLTRTQFAILEYLVRHRGHWRSPDIIIREVLGTCHQRGNSVIRFHVHGLRQALGQSRCCVRWQRGKGYMFDLAPANEKGDDDGTAPAMSSR